MTCECGHIKAQHQFNGKFCFQCSCTKYRKQTKNESTPDEAYLDRNLAVQAFGKLAMQNGFNVGIKPDGEYSILYIDLPTGQVSWHIPKDELIDGFPEYKGKWDGHDLETKRNRLKAYMEAMK